MDGAAGELSSRMFGLDGPRPRRRRKMALMLCMNGMVRDCGLFEGVVERNGSVECDVLERL